MIVDIGRTSRTSWFRFFDPALPRAATSLPVSAASRSSLGFFAATAPLRRVRWYFAPPGALPLPQGTIFAGTDHNTLIEDTQVVYGELPYAGNRKYNKGEAPAGATGQKFCGKPDDFLRPKVWSDSLPTLPVGASGLPLCCNAFAGAAIGFVRPADPSRQLALTGTAIIPQPLYLVSSLPLADSFMVLSTAAIATEPLFLASNPISLPILQLETVNVGGSPLALLGGDVKPDFIMFSFLQILQAPLVLFKPTVETGQLVLIDTKFPSGELELLTVKLTLDPLEITAFNLPLDPLLLDVSIFPSPDAFLILNSVALPDALLQLAGLPVTLGPLELVPFDLLRDPLIFFGRDISVGLLSLISTPLAFDQLELLAGSGGVPSLTASQLEFDQVYGVTAQCCPMIESPMRVTLQVTAAGFPFDGLTFPLVGLYVLDRVEWRGPQQDNAFGHGSAFLDSLDADPGNIIVGFEFFTFIGVNDYTGDTFFSVPIGSCLPFGFSINVDIFLNGVDQFTTATISVFSIP